MMAYILINFDAGNERTAFAKLKEVEEVKDINMIFGEWDIIAKVEVIATQDLENFIIDKVRTLPGVNLTSTLIVAK